MTLALALAVTQCSKSSTSPSDTGGMSGVTLSATTVAAGTTVQATVTLKAAASSAMSITMASSNPAIATVQSPVTVPAGASSAAVTVTGVGAGTATIGATLNGATSQSPMLTVTSGTRVSAVSLSASSVVGGQPVTGTVTLSAAAPAGGANAALTATDPVTVPASVLVPAGAASATFSIVTKAVSSASSVTIGASYGGGSASAVLAVTQPTVATANFGVSGPTETETCGLINNGTALDCSFNGTTSTAPGAITAWDWSYAVGTGTGLVAQTTTSPVLTTPAFNCGLLPPPPFPAGSSFFLLVVKLKIHDNAGNVSAEATNDSVRLFPRGLCGF